MVQSLPVTRVVRASMAACRDAGRPRGVFVVLVLHLAFFSARRFSRHFRTLNENNLYQAGPASFDKIPCAGNACYICEWGKARQAPGLDARGDCIRIGPAIVERGR